MSDEECRRLNISQLVLAVVLLVVVAALEYQIFSLATSVSELVGDKVIGEYSGSEIRILVDRHRDAEHLIGTAYHEVAHWVWNNELSRKDREEYAAIFGAASDYVNEYAATSAEEDFCESMRYYFAGRDVPEDRLDFVRSAARYWG